MWLSQAAILNNATKRREAADAAKQHIARCVVGDMDDGNGTDALLAHFFPWVDLAELPLTNTREIHLDAVVRCALLKLFWWL